jgi:hypothetical protein
MTPVQMPLDEPTALEEAIEDAVATGATPFWHGYTRDDEFKDRKRWPVEKMALALMERATPIYGARPDVIACAPQNVEALSRLDGVRVLRRPDEGPRVVSIDTIFLGSGAWR